MSRYQGSANVSNANPHQNSRVTVYGILALLENHLGHGVPGERMVTTWHFKSRNSQCSAITGDNGKAECSRDIGRATKGYTVFIDVAFVAVDTGHILDEAKVSFTPV